MQTNENRRESLPAPWLAVVQRAFGYAAAKHFFEAHRLTAELKRVLRALFRLSALILHGIGLPQAVPVGEGNSLCSPAVFQNVALPADA